MDGRRFREDTYRLSGVVGETSLVLHKPIVPVVDFHFCGQLDILCGFTPGLNQQADG